MRTDFYRRVMAAAGVPQSGKVCTCRHEISYHIHDGGALGGHGTLGPCAACECDKWIGLSVYPDPLTPEGFVALWDALEARGYEADITFDQGDKLHDVVIYSREDGRTLVADACHKNRAAALLGAAALALDINEL